MHADNTFVLSKMLLIEFMRVPGMNLFNWWRLSLISKKTLAVPGLCLAAVVFVFLGFYYDPCIAGKVGGGNSRRQEMELRRPTEGRN